MEHSDESITSATSSISTPASSAPCILQTMEHSDESTSATSAISTAESSAPSTLMNIADDILRNIFMRVPSQEYPQIWRTCRALKELLNDGMFLGRYIEEQVVEREEIMVPVKLRWMSRVARYRNRRSFQGWWELGYNLGSCYYRCYNIRKFMIRENPETPVPCHGRLFCPWIECATWHKWLDVGFVRTFLRNREPELENNTNGPHRHTAHRLCSVCSREDSCSCMGSLLCIKNPITGIYKKLPVIHGKWTSKLKCIARYNGHYFQVLVAMLADTNHYLVKTMIYDPLKDSWREPPNCSQYLLHNIRVVDTHGVFCRGVMYWLLEATQNLIIFSMKTEKWEILKVHQPQRHHPLGLVICKDQVLMVGTNRPMMVGTNHPMMVGKEDPMLVIWNLIRHNLFNQSSNERLEWQVISRSHEAYVKLIDTKMTLHSAICPNGDDIICFENFDNGSIVTFSMNTRLWGGL